MNGKQKLEYSENVHCIITVWVRWSGTHLLKKEIIESKTGKTSNKPPNKLFHWDKQWGMERGTPISVYCCCYVLASCWVGTPSTTHVGNERMRDELWLEAFYQLLNRDWTSLSIVQCLSQRNSFVWCLVTSFSFNCSSLPPLGRFVPGCLTPMSLPVTMNNV